MTYRSDFADGTPIRLLAPLSDPQPPGFERDKYRRWSRRVERSELSRTFIVKTTAVWKGQPVSVRSVLGDCATIELCYQDASRFPELTHHQHGLLDGTVPVDSLSDASETVVEIPL
ncbi:hypothetical protein AA0Y32_08550 [Georgenia phoenicis]|uniref:hypothetical protein n=1 Tax=Georgenia sp. 1P07AB TaxID=554105 RepID=UPI0039AEFBA1